MKQKTASDALNALFDNLNNGNLADAKRAARRFDAYELQMGFVDLGWSHEKAAAAANYLKNPSQKTFQVYCDAI